jgi:hypothetical protein
MTPQRNAKLTQEIYNAFSNNQFNDVLARSAEGVEIVFTPTGQVSRAMQASRAPCPTSASTSRTRSSPTTR